MSSSLLLPILRTFLRLPWGAPVPWNPPGAGGLEFDPGVHGNRTFRKYMYLRSWAHKKRADCCCSVVSFGCVFHHSPDPGEASKQSINLIKDHLKFLIHNSWIDSCIASCGYRFVNPTSKSFLSEWLGLSLARLLNCLIVRFTA